MKDARSAKRIVDDIAQHLAQSPPLDSIDKILQRFLDEISGCPVPRFLSLRNRFHTRLQRLANFAQQGFDGGIVRRFFGGMPGGANLAHLG